MKTIKLKDLKTLPDKGWLVKKSDRKAVKNSLDVLKTQQAFDHLSKTAEIQIMEAQKGNELMVILTGEIHKLNKHNKILKKYRFTVNRDSNDRMTTVDLEQIR